MAQRTYHGHCRAPSIDRPGPGNSTQSSRSNTKSQRSVSRLRNPRREAPKLLLAIFVPFALFVLNSRRTHCPGPVTTGASSTEPESHQMDNETLMRWPHPCHDRPRVGHLSPTASTRPQIPASHIKRRNLVQSAMRQTGDAVPPPHPVSTHLSSPQSDLNLTHRAMRRP